MTIAVLDLLAAVLCLVGSLLCLTAAIGLARFPDLVSRLHPAAKPQSLGMVVLMAGLALHIRTPSAVLLLSLVTILQMMTVTLSSHVVARTGYRSGLVDPSTLVADELAEAIADRRRAGVQRGADERAAVQRHAAQRGALLEPGARQERDARQERTGPAAPEDHRSGADA